MKYICIIWILTSLSCLAASTNMDDAALTVEIANEDMFGMVLSAETNSLKSGIWMDDTNHILVVQNGEMVDQHATVVTLNTSTNKISFGIFGLQLICNLTSSWLMTKAMKLPKLLMVKDLDDRQSKTLTA